MISRVPKLLVLVSALFIPFTSLGCKKYDPFATPQETLRTFVKAYNSGDKVMLKKCGVVEELLDVLTYEDDHAGLIRHVPVEEIELSILSCEYKRPDITKRFTTDKAVVTCKFTSKSDSSFSLTIDILLAKKRHSFQDFSETSKWQIMQVLDSHEY